MPVAQELVCALVAKNSAESGNHCARGTDMLMWIGADLKEEAACLAPTAPRAKQTLEIL